MIDEAMIRHDYEMLQPSLSERGRRMFAAAQVRALGYGGLAAVARATGLAPSTIGRALKELASGTVADGRVRRPGGGRKKLVDQDSSLMSDLERLVEPVTLGDPERPLRWVSKQVDRLLSNPGIDVKELFMLWVPPIIGSGLIYSDSESGRKNRLPGERDTILLGA